jgi:hypothetical protein
MISSFAIQKSQFEACTDMPQPANSLYHSLRKKVLATGIAAGFTDISADGRVIVGYGVHNGDQEAWRVVVPEPPGLFLALAGLPGLLACPLCRRRRQQR